MRLAAGGLTAARTSGSLEAGSGRFRPLVPALDAPDPGADAVAAAAFAAPQHCCCTSAADDAAAAARGAAAAAAACGTATAAGIGRTPAGAVAARAAAPAPAAVAATGCTSMHRRTLRRRRGSSRRHCCMAAKSTYRSLSIATLHAPAPVPAWWPVVKLRSSSCATVRAKRCHRPPPCHSQQCSPVLAISGHEAAHHCHRPPLSKRQQVGRVYMHGPLAAGQPAMCPLSEVSGNSGMGGSYSD